MTEFGGGIYLTQDLDFEVNNAGDIRTITGTDELLKDLAYQSIAQLNRFIGSPKTPNTSELVRAELVGIAEDDPRIDEVTAIEVTFVDGSDEIEVAMNAIVDESEQELVFSINGV